MTKRSKTKYPGLVRGVNAKFRHQNIDFDYIDKLYPEDKQWLSNFMEEYLSGNKKHQGKRLFRTKKEFREAYHRNNCRNRDLFNVLKVTGKLLRAEEYKSSIEDSNGRSPEGHENIIIQFIDNYVRG